MGHYSNECPQPDKRSTGVQLLQCDDASASEDPKDYAFCFATAAVRHVNQNWIQLDSESTVSIFSNARFLTNIRPSTDPNCLRIISNGGSQDAHLVGDLPGVGEVWYNERSLANILSLAQVRRVCRVTMDSAKDAAFIVHRHNKSPLVFTESPTGLYYHDAGVPTKTINENTDTGYSFVNSVADNKGKYTDRQVDGANLAKRVYELVGRPSHSLFLKMIRHNQLANCPVTVDDANRALDIYGTNVDALRGKTVRRAVDHVASNQLSHMPCEFMKKHGDVTLCFDIFYVDEMKFILTVSRNIRFITIHSIPTRGIKKNVLPSLKKVVLLYAVSA